MNSALLRRWHSYIGLFAAPSVIFFALTGALQIFNLHEAHGDYRPAPVVQMLSSIHKDQVSTSHDDHGDGPPGADRDANGAPPTGAPGQPPDDDRVSALTMALKWFFLLIAIGLIGSSTIGVWIGLSQMRQKRLAWGLLVAGALIPVALLVL